MLPYLSKGGYSLYGTIHHFVCVYFNMYVLLLQAQTLVTTSVHQDVVYSTVVASLLPATDMSSLIELFNLSKQYSVKFMQK